MVVVVCVRWIWKMSKLVNRVVVVQVPIQVVSLQMIVVRRVERVQLVHWVVIFHLMLRLMFQTMFCRVFLQFVDVLVFYFDGHRGNRY